MKQTLLVAFALVVCLSAFSQNGYIYIHNKSINEASSTDFTCNITGGPTTVPTFVLNDKPDFIQVGDIGASHSTSTGTTGNGELWAISSGSTTYGASVASTTGKVYRRPANSSQWAAITMPSGVTANNIDGAGPGACVYTSTTGDVYYYNGTSTFKIFCANAGTPSGSLGNARDVAFGYTANRTAILSSNGNIYVFNPSGTGAGSYGANNTNAAGTTATNANWTLITRSGVSNLTAGNRLDMNYAGDKIVYTITGPSFVYFNADNTGSATTVALNNTGVTTVNGSTGALSGTTIPTDIAYDDNGVIYCQANISVSSCNATFGTPIIFRWASGTTFTEEGEGRQLSRLTGGAAGQMWGVSDYGFANTIWTRATDNTGQHVWIDDERVRVASGVQNGNSIMIPVAAGTYTFTETIPSGYDLGRFNIYDPSGNTTGAPYTNTVSINVSAGEVVNVEVINEFLIPKSIDLTCTTQILQDFGTGSSDFGPAAAGTAYHYINSSSPQDGDYYLVHKVYSSGTNQNWFTGGDTIRDHTTGTTNSGYFLLVNASYARDEFYRQRVTNLVPGLSYTISFYVANILSCNPINPKIKFGLQDVYGNILSPQTTADITSTKWEYKFVTFTATTSTADLFLANANIGGLGNDVVIDDISLNPVLNTLGNNEINPTVAPNICLGTSYKFTNSASNDQNGTGTWTSSNTNIVRINANTGVVTYPANATGGTVVISFSFTNALGCTSDTSRTFTVTAPPVITSVSNKLGSIICKNSVDSVFATATGTGTLSYLWAGLPSATAGISNPTNQNTQVQPTAASTTYKYYVTVTDPVGCSAVDTVTIATSASTAPALSAVAGATTVCYGATTTLAATATPTASGSATYTWSGPGTFSPNGTNAAKNTTVTPASSGTYSVLLNDGGCKTQAVTSIVAANPAMTVAPQSSLPAICQSQVTTISANASGGTPAYSYVWSGAKTGTTSSITFSSTSTTTQVYTFTVLATDSKGCTATGSTTVQYTKNSNSNLVLTASLTPTSVCLGTQITLNTSRTGGSGSNFRYTWTGPAGTITSSTYTNNNSTTSTTATPTASGTYEVDLIDANGCGATATTGTVTVKALPAITSATATAPSKICAGSGIPLTAVATGVGTLSYNWSTVTTPTLTTITGYSPNNSTTANNTIATVGLGVTSLNTVYQFSVTVTDATTTCSASLNTPTYNISSNTLATAPTLSSTSVSYSGNICANQTALTFTTTRNKTLNNYSYTWSGPGVNNTFTDNTNSNTKTYSDIITPTTSGSGVYTVTLTDGNGCTAAAQTSTQTVYGSPTVTASSNTSGYCLSNAVTDVGLLSTATAAGSATISSYAWTASPTAGSGIPTGQSGQNISVTPTAAGTYTYTVKATDNLGCYATSPTTAVIVGTNPSVTIAKTLPSTLCTGQSIGLKATVSGGNANYSYAWASSDSTSLSRDTTLNTSSPTNTITAYTRKLSTNTNFAYTVAVVDGSNCVARGSSGIIALYATPFLSISAFTPVSVCRDPATTLNLSANVDSGATPTAYVWSGSGVTAASALTTTATPSVTGTYQIIGTDVNGCKDTATSISVTVDQATPVIQASCFSNGGPNGNTAYVRLSETTGNSWLWTASNSANRFYGSSALSTSNDGLTSTAATTYVTARDIYTISIVNSNGCKGSATKTVDGATCGSTVLALALDFTAQKQNGGVSLNWATAAEQPNDRFDVERSSDGTNWQTLGSVAGLGGLVNHYNYTDASPVTGPNYYRLKQVSANGHFGYSAVRTVRFTGEFVVHVYPNPATDFLVLEFNNDKDEKAAISIQTSLGGTVFLKEQTIVKGLNRIKLNQIQPLAQGTYVITLATANNIYRSKFVKGSR